MDKYKILIGNETKFIFAGPCAVENMNMMEETIVFLSTLGIKTIRAGIFKPRTCCDSFQGYGFTAIAWLKELKRKYQVLFVSEIVDIRQFEKMSEVIDVFQVGTRNMSNFEMLKELGKTKVTVLLKRGYCSTIREFIKASEYIYKNGNANIILCERGIRSFDNETRNLLDLTSVAVIKQETNMPIVVDISHSLGRKDIAIPLSNACFACGADGLMIEVHPNPDIALSDAAQQMNFYEFKSFMDNICEKNRRV